ncbi:MBL fold metallo-hydrolase [Mesobacterium sp. TK19101]|uniref:MBL fold metallo-hydrolase n=1 Tax=Mesobacterium hydrothermale TaxID=3111907 RepID=A0ABU6HF18_9RHOB|nr:MBL fold metallo-hydrolase [Mesobacterium sp. TK19101]MEC3860440.1 MBL fold metallo-hydrolase [Mesobacterium sp. TK19101]
MQDPDPDFRPVPGLPETLAPGLRRVLAPNPSPMTFRGTNTYLLGETGLAVIDPGPDDNAHLAAILAALQPGQHISHIVVTHAHVDHSPLARPLAAATGAPVIAFGDALAGRSAVMQALAANSAVGGGEGVDTAFTPDQYVAGGDVIAGDTWQLKVWHTPGHFGNHISLEWGDALFCGDLVMGWASSLVSPPDGDLTDFLTSCEALLGRDWSVFHSGHGAPITDPTARLRWLIAHRRAREAAILETLAQGAATAQDLARCIYTETPPALLPAATRNVLAHLIDLMGKSRVAHTGPLHAGARFELC